MDGVHRHDLDSDSREVPLTGPSFVCFQGFSEVIGGRDSIVRWIGMTDESEMVTVPQVVRRAGMRDTTRQAWSTARVTRASCIRAAGNTGFSHVMSAPGVDGLKIWPQCCTFHCLGPLYSSG